MDDLINDFIAETREMLEALGGEIVAWEAEPQDRARLDAIFRFVHTVKGNCGFFDLPRLKALSHAAEDALAEVRSGKRIADHGLVSAVLAVIDRIGELVQALETGDTLVSADDAPLIDALSPTAAAPEPLVSEPTAAGPARGAARTIRLPVDLLDRMMSSVSDLVLARNELARRLRESPAGVEVEAAFDRASGTIAEIRDAITRTRMQRIDNLFAPLPRMVRDLSAETGKQVALEIDGGDVELDREMIEMIRDPLSHIVRNAMDHGIEPAAERRAAGKPETGALSVCARQTGNQILIEIKDDGRGLDGGRLAAKAVSLGLLGEDRADRLSPAQQAALIFEPGLSTAAEVTALSGRGVGMDVVRANIERIGGIVDVDSRPGRGLRLTLRVPLTLTIIPALTVSVGGQIFAIPRSAIEEIVRVKGGFVRIETLGGARVATIRGRRVPLVPLCSVLGCEPAVEPDEQSLIVLGHAGGDVFALAVDQVHDHEELVVKPAAPAVMAAGLYAGTTLADDGKPVLLLDPPGIAACAGISLERAGAGHAEAPPEAAASEGIPALLFKSCAGGRRIVPLAAIERIEDVPAESVRLSAGRLHVAVGERILPLEGCGGVPVEGGLRILRLTDGAAQIAYGLAAVVDIVTLGGDIRPASAPGEISGVTLIGDEQVEVLDLHWLFAAQAGGAETRAERPVCVLPAGDPWMDNILRPIVESAGYRVLRSGDAGAEAADVVVLNAGEEDAGPKGPAKVLRLRSDIERSGRKDDSIHRYDRAGLLSALGSLARKKG
jgi:two-component system, chemotaxis family, sensor kinase CheA